MAAVNEVAVFLQHDVGVQIPDDGWSPVPFNVRRLVTGESVLDGFVAASTTIAAGSNGAALPQATIDVDSTEEFSAWGYILIRVGTTDRVVQYSAKNATQFLGCTFGVGTLTTGDAVRQGLVDILPPRGQILGVIAEWAWVSNATGVRGCRLRDRSSFQFIAGGDVRGAVATPAAAPLRSWCAEQPATPSSGGNAFRCELYQNSGTVGGLSTAVPSALDLGFPRLVAAFLVDF